MKVQYSKSVRQKLSRECQLYFVQLLLLATGYYSDPSSLLRLIVSKVIDAIHGHWLPRSVAICARYECLAIKRTVLELAA